MTRLGDFLDIAVEYVVVAIAPDGEMSAHGIFNGEYAATMWANDDDAESRYDTCHVLPVRAPERGE